MFPNRGGVSSVPVIDYIYLAITYVINNIKQRGFDNLFEEKYQRIRNDLSFNPNDLKSHYYHLTLKLFIKSLT